MGDTPDTPTDRAADLVTRDRKSVWHPYAPPEADPLFAVESAEGVHLQLCDGLTHEPAVRLCERLIALTPDRLKRVFLCDSGSIAVEVAIKIAFQYWLSIGQPKRNRLLTVRGGYHGDTFATMAICDPVNGMHDFFRGVLPDHVFAERPSCRFDERFEDRHIADLAAKLEAHRDELAAVILEPVVQGAGGMWFYAPEYLRRLRALCDANDVLLIFDEIATGFGRTGEMFGADHAGVAPDILSLGKSLTGGTLTLAATLVSEKLAEAIAAGEPGALMHGPTYMGNPLACAAAHASLDLLEQTPWRERVKAIEAALPRRARCGGCTSTRRNRGRRTRRTRRHEAGATRLRRARRLGAPLRPPGLLDAALCDEVRTTEIPDRRGLFRRPQLRFR